MAAANGRGMQWPNAAKSIPKRDEFQDPLESFFLESNLQLHGGLIGCANIVCYVQFIVWMLLPLTPLLSSVLKASVSTERMQELKSVVYIWPL